MFYLILFSVLSFRTRQARILERVMSFALALEHGKELAMPVDSRTQAKT